MIEPPPPFIRDRAEIVERCVSAPGVVPAFEIVEDHRAGRLACRPRLRRGQFALESGEERFDECIVVSIARPSHRRDQTTPLQPFTKGKRGVLAATVRVMNQPGCWLPTPERQVQGIRDELRSQVMGHRPAEGHPLGLAVESIEDDRELQPTLTGCQTHSVGAPSDQRPRADWERRTESFAGPDLVQQDPQVLAWSDSSGGADDNRQARRFASGGQCASGHNGRPGHEVQHAPVEPRRWHGSGYESCGSVRSTPDLPDYVGRVCDDTRRSSRNGRRRAADTSR